MPRLTISDSFEEYYSQINSFGETIKEYFGQQVEVKSSIKFAPISSHSPLKLYIVKIRISGISMEIFEFGSERVEIQEAIDEVINLLRSHLRKDYPNFVC